MGGPLEGSCLSSLLGYLSRATSTSLMQRNSERTILLELYTVERLQLLQGYTLFALAHRKEMASSACSQFQPDSWHPRKCANCHHVEKRHTPSRNTSEQSPDSQSCSGAKNTTGHAKQQNPSLPPSRTFTVKHLTNSRQGHDPKAWVNKQHTITIVATHARDVSTDQLFVDHHHIHRNNWQWINQRSQLVWQQGSGEGYMAGHVAFDADGREGAGSMQVGTLREPVLLNYQHPSYSCDLSADAGAYVVKLGAAFAVKWDTTSSKWEDATWVTDAFTFTYWTEKAGMVGDQQLYQTRVVFDDVKTQNSWDVVPNTFSSEISSESRFTFNINAGYFPPADDRSQFGDGIKSTFPYQMSFDFSQLAIDISGGAMLTTKYDVDGDVYAMRGKSQNLYAVGTYSLLSDGNDEVGTLTTHGRKLVVGNKVVAKSGISGNRLSWEGLSSEEERQTGLPAAGFADFSSGGHVIKSSSFGARGIRALSSAASASPSAVSASIGAMSATTASGSISATSASTSLQLQDLLAMNPYVADSDGNISDGVQQNAMEDFYKIIQYYMPSDYLHDFIAPSPPDIGDLRDIAEDDKETNEEWYSSLAVPYLVQALSTATGVDAVTKLNARRAQQVLQQSTANSEVYRDQTAKLYSYEWQKKFPLMTQFLNDQRDNAASHNPAIEQDAEEWKAEIREGLEEATDPDEIARLDQMTEIPDDARKAGENGLYWAYIFFRYLTSPNYLMMLQMQMMNGNTSQTVTQDVQRYSAILSILDTTSYFAELFVKVVGIYQLTSLLPSVFDVSGNVEDYTYFMGEITQAFIDKYVDSQDPQMSAEAQVVQKELEVAGLQDYLTLFNASASVLGNDTWTTLANDFSKSAIAKFGSAAAGKVADMLSLAAVSFGIYWLASGMIDWSDLTPVQQASFVASCVPVLVVFLRRGISAAVAFSSGQGLWESFKVLLYKDLTAVPPKVYSTFGGWLQRNSANATDADVIYYGLDNMDAEFAAENPRLVLFVGRNLEEFMATRFAAVMSVVGIVLNAINLSKSSTPLETAENSLFLASATLDLISAVSSWALVGVEVVADTTMSTFVTILSCAGPLAIAAAVAGIVIMIVLMSKTKKPANPIKTFTESDAVEQAGLYKEYSAAIDDFQVIDDEDGSPRDLGVSLAPTAGGYYLNVDSDGTTSLGALTYGYSSVLSVSTDYQGYSAFLTKVWDSEGQISILALTLDDDKTVKMAAKITDDKKASQQQWMVTCQGSVVKDDSDHLTEAVFTIYNVYWGKSLAYSLSGSEQKVTYSSSPKKWTLTMQPMKPEMLSFSDITLRTDEKDHSYYPYLIQVGSISGQKWSVKPALPDWLQLDKSTGMISQPADVAPPVYPRTKYQMKVKNISGKATATFYIEVKVPDSSN